ncbi:MAG: hypothetical protein C0483_18575 [Pirellula sp.]|nr:hypothetical protein [Pirellula sp.]
MRNRWTTPTGEKAKSLIKKIDRWILNQEDESSLDWTYQGLVDQLEELYGSMQDLDKERRQTERDERSAKGGSA